MLKFLKNFGLGLLYILLFPLILVGVVFYALVGFIRCLFEFFAIVFRFFRGEKIFPPYPEDVKAQAILAKTYGLKEEKEEPAPAPANNVYVQQNYYQQPMTDQNPALGQQPPYFNQPYQQMP